MGVFGAGSSLQSFHVAFVMTSVGGECIVHTVGGRVMRIESGRWARSPADPCVYSPFPLTLGGLQEGHTWPLLFL